MNREQAKANLMAILGSEPTDEQITTYLNGFHGLNESLTKANDTINSLNEKVTTLTQSEIELNSIKQAQLTEQEKFELKQKEMEVKEKLIQDKLAEASVITNTAKAREIFSEIGGIDDEVLKAVVSDNEEATIKNATALLNQIKAIKETTINQTKQDIASLNIKPNPSNVLDDNAMTWDKFSQMSDEEQSNFAEQHPDILETL